MDDSIIFIKLRDDMKRDINGFTVDPAVPLPVEKRTGQDNYDPNDLSWEMIIAAMLKIMAYDRDFEHIDYYRQFIKAVKPDLFKEMTQVGIFKAGNKDFAIAEEIFMALEGLNPDQLKQKVEDVQGTLQKMSDAKDKIAVYAESIKQFMDSASDLFDKVRDFLSRFQK